MVRKILNTIKGLPGRAINAVRGRVLLSGWRRCANRVLRRHNSKKAVEARRDRHVADIRELSKALAAIPWGNRRYNGKDGPPKNRLPIPKELECDFRDFAQ
jgi:hypothetical protein